jgi:hypothetical protein
MRTYRATGESSRSIASGWRGGYLCAALGQAVEQAEQKAARGAESRGVGEHLLGGLDGRRGGPPITASPSNAGTGSPV